MVGHTDDERGARLDVPAEAGGSRLPPAPDAYASNAAARGPTPASASTAPASGSGSAPAPAPASASSDVELSELPIVTGEPAIVAASSPVSSSSVDSACVA